MDQRILDAAGQLVARHGISKTTMEGVARATRCSRAGLYKHFATKDELLRALFLREVENFLAELRRHVERRRGPRHLENAFVFAVRYVRTHPIAKGVLETEMDLVTTTFTRSDGIADTAITATASLVEVLIERGDIRRTDSRALAELLLRLLISFVLSSRLGDNDDDVSMRKIFRHVLLEGLAPS